MIVDKICRLGSYSGVIPRLDRMVEFLRQADFGELPSGDCQIDGDDLYLKVLRFEPWPESTNGFETHRRYVDVQCVVGGCETMRLAPNENLVAKAPFDETADFGFATCDDRSLVSEIVAEAGTFVVFFPGEAHEPGVRGPASSKYVTKLVFKSRVG